LITSFVVILFSNLFRVYLFTHQLSLHWYALSYSIEAACYPLGYFLQYVSKKKMFNSKLYSIDVIVLIRDSWPLIISTIIVGLFTKLALINLAKYNEPFEVGRFSLLLRVIEGMLIIATSTSVLQLKKLLNAGDKYNEIKNRYIKTMYLVATIVSIIAYVLVSIFIPVVFGQEYEFSANIAFVTSIIVFFNFIGIYNGRLLVVEGYYYFPLIRNTLSLLIFVVYNNMVTQSLESSLLSLLITWVFSSFICMLITGNTRRMLFFEYKK
ncbi:hypothetical protein AB4251_23090, partial [Vibrio lentus]